MVLPWLCDSILFEVVIMQRLTEKQKKFVNEYLIDLNATQAAARAGYSKRTAAVTASKLLIKANIQQEIQKRQNARAQRTEITQDRVLHELASIGFADIADYLSTDNGSVSIKRTSDIPQDKRSAIAGIKENATGGIEVKLNDKIRALELIGKHIGMFNGDAQKPGDNEDDNFYAAVEKAVKGRDEQ
jgi:phage terminase small subunit